MGRIVDPLIYIDGVLRDDVKSWDITVKRDKAAEFVQNPAHKALHSSHGNISFEFSMTIKPVAGRVNKIWREYVMDRSEHEITVDEDGELVLYKGCEFNDCKQARDAGANGTDLTVTGFAKDFVQLQ